MKFNYEDKELSSLTTDEVLNLTSLKKDNRSYKKKKNEYLGIVVKNTFTFFNILMFIIFVVLLICKKYFQTFFFLIVVANTLIAIIQEIRAKVLVNKLKLVNSNKVEVVRDNDEVILIEKEKVVLNDILVIKSGFQLVCDGVLLSGEAYVDESMLTGESNRILKKVGDSLYSGSIVTKGSGYMQATSVGDSCFVSNIEDKSKQKKTNKSMIFKTLNKLVKILTLILIPLSIWAFCNNLLVRPEGDLNNSFFDTNNYIANAISKTAGAVVSMIPNGLFLLTSIALAKGVIALARKKTLTNNLYSIENLARVDCLCFDKTGTLTTNKLVVNSIIYLNKEEKETNDELLATFCNSFKDANLTMLSLQNYFKDVDRTSLNMNISEINEFDNVKKCSSVVINNIKYIMGAPEYVYNLEKDKELNNKLETYKKEGHRVLLFINDETKEVISIIVIEEELRKNIKESIDWFYNNNVKLKVISGDNLDTVKVISKNVGIKDYDNGVSLKGVSIEETRKLALTYSIFTRVSPEQKEAIVEELIKNGHYVGMTGDGVNDLLALKSANCSIAMGEGSTATKSIADITLLDNDFNRLPYVVKQGRQVINNIQQSSSLFLSRTFFAIFITLLTNIMCYVTDISSMFTTNNYYLISICGIGIPGFLLALRPNDSLIKDNYVKKMMFEAIPGCLGMALVVICGIIMNYSGFYNEIAPIGNLSNELTHGLNTSLIIGMLFVNWTLLFIVSYPYNKWSVMIIVGVVFVALVYVFIPKFILKDHTYDVTGIDYSLMDFRLWMSVLIYLVLAPSVVASTLFLFRYILKKEDSKVKSKKVGV